MVNYYFRIFFVSILINSTEGWLIGFTFNKELSIRVSNIKNVNNSPKVSSLLFLISKLLNDNFFLLNTLDLKLFTILKLKLLQVMQLNKI